jgi:hypothetical protein
MGYQHPEWWTPRLEREAVRLARKRHLKRCRVCGVIMRAEDTVCGDVPDPMPGEHHRQ